MNANQSTFPDTEQHWQELHSSPSFNASALLKSATDTLRRSPLLGIGGAAVAGFAIGRLLLGNRSSSHGFSKLIAASVIPAASKGLHHAFDSVKEHLSDSGESANKMVHRHAKKATRWAKSLTH